MVIPRSPIFFQPFSLFHTLQATEGDVSKPKDRGSRRDGDTIGNAQQDTSLNKSMTIYFNDVITKGMITCLIWRNRLTIISL